MTKSITKKLITLAITVFMAFAVVSFTACPNGGGTYFCNDTSPFVLSLSQPDGVFSPFFSSAAMDSEIVGQTQASLITTDMYGNKAFGPEHAVIAYDVSIHTTLRPGTNEPMYTTYQFVLRRDARFSDGRFVTVRDVLFSMYVLLDPVYIGTRTLNSVDIVGLREFRTQNPQADEYADDDFTLGLRTNATERVNFLITYLTARGMDTVHLDNLTVAQQNQLRSDYAQARVYFREELTSFYNAIEGSVPDRRRQMENVSYDWEVFFNQIGRLPFRTDMAGRPERIDGYLQLAPEARNTIVNAFNEAPFNGVFSRENAIAIAYSLFLPNTPAAGEANPFNRNALFGTQILRGWGTRVSMINRLMAEKRTAHFQDLLDRYGHPIVRNIEGIRAVRGSEFNPCANYSRSTTPYSDEFEVLQVTIEEVDPAAIWLMGVSVAPMHWYSNQEQYNLAMAWCPFDDADDMYNFGVATMNSDFFNDVLRAANSTPMGAGPYRISTAQGSAGLTREQLAAGFFSDNVIYFERNEYFMLGRPVINLLRYQVVSPANVMNALTTGQIHYATPSATPANQSQLATHANLTSRLNLTHGYGYIGINAYRIPELGIRRAIMAAIDIDMVNSYFPGVLSEPLHVGRPLSCWTHNLDNAIVGLGPWQQTSRYGRIGTDIANMTTCPNNAWRLTEVSNHLAADNISWDSSLPGWRRENGTTLDFTFHVAGETTDHPAWMMFEVAAGLLNANGWNITVRNDAQLLMSLGQGNAPQVWAAAWSSGVDPNPFQLFHYQSLASSVRNYGIPWLLHDAPDTLRFNYQRNMVLDIAYYIDLGRSTNDRRERAETYRTLFGRIMDLAIELPTYNRMDMFVFNTNVVDMTTIQHSDSPFWPPLARIWEVSLVTA